MDAYQSDKMQTTIQHIDAIRNRVLYFRVILAGAMDAVSFQTGL